jgi:hypothetical protein
MQIRLSSFNPPENVKLIYRTNATFNEETVELYYQEILANY